MLSYNQIIERFRAFADAHYIIKGSFGTGEAWQIVEHNKLKNRKYPLMWVEDLPFPYSQSEAVYSFRVYFLAQVATLKNQTSTTLEQTNVVEVKSDMLQCAQDLLTFWVQDHVYDELDIDKATSAVSFNQEFNDNLTGWYIDIKLEQAMMYDVCAIPASGVPDPPVTCSPATYQNSDSSFTQSIASGGTYTAPDVTITINGTPQTPIPANTNASFTIDIPTLRNSANPYKTGQDVEYTLTGDDGATQRGRGASWTVLDFTNIFSNTNRFNDTSGGQTYSNNIVIDTAYTDYVNEKVLGWYKVPVTGDTLQNYQASAPYTYEGYNDWVIPNYSELNTILKAGSSWSNPLNYAPFNLDLATYGWWWTVTISAILNRYLFHSTAWSRNLVNFSGGSVILCRYFTFSELGL